MTFNSVEFLIFLIAVVGCHWFLGHRAQNLKPLGASYLFYGAWNWKFLALILLTTAVDYTVALIGAIAVNLCVLGLFKTRQTRVPLLFVTAPLLLACSADQRPLFARFAKLAREWGVPYRSFLTATQPPADFHDQNHINRASALRYSSWTADALAANILRGNRGK